MRAVCPTCHREFDPGTPTCPDDGERLLLVRPDPTSLLVGTVLDGRFRVDRLLGQGGMGAVYVGTQISVGREVAIKVIQPGQVADADTVKRFHREAQVISRLTHSHTVHLIDFGQTEQGLLYLVMEYVRGRALSHDMELGPLPPPRVATIAGQVCDALAEAHAQGIVHRDLKPDNILLTTQAGSDDFVKILDFGIAKVAGQTERAMTTLTEAGAIVGTPQYMSPEQIGGTEAVTGSSDLYSLTVVVFEMLAGRAPFTDPSPMTLLIQHLQGVPPRLLAVSPECRAGEAVDEFLARNLAKDPAQRSPDALTWKADLFRALAAQPPPRPSRPLPRRAPTAISASVKPTVALPRAAEAPATLAYMPTPLAEVPAAPAPPVSPASSSTALAPVTQGAGRFKLWLLGLGALALAAVSGVTVWLATAQGSAATEEPAAAPAAAAPPAVRGLPAAAPMPAAAAQGAQVRSGPAAVPVPGPVTSPDAAPAPDEEDAPSKAAGSRGSGRRNDKPAGRGKSEFRLD